MALIEINWKPSSKDLRVFAVLQMVFFGIVAALVDRRTGSTIGAAAIAGASLLVGAVGLAFPGAVRRLYLAWMAASYPIGWVVSHVALGVVYFGVFTAFGLAMRLCGRDPMNRRIDRSARTYWTARNPATDVARYFRQF